MRISDWSSDVCSSDLLQDAGTGRVLLPERDVERALQRADHAVAVEIVGRIGAVAFADQDQGRVDDVDVRAVDDLVSRLGRRGVADVGIDLTALQYRDAVLRGTLDELARSEEGRYGK